MKVVATIGGLEVPVGSYTVSPDPLVAGTTEVVLTYELDGKTATGTQSITVNTLSTVLQQNSWEDIAKAAAKGEAKNWWNVGDTKTAVVNGENLLMTIMGFDHYTLATSDAKYNDTTYNNGSKKAGITFMATTIPKSSRDIISEDATKYNYGYGEINTYLEDTLISKFPFASSLMREVVIGYMGSNYPASNTDRQSDYQSLSSNRKLFLPGYGELGGTGVYIAGQTKFAYITAGNIPNWKFSTGVLSGADISLRDVDYGSTDYPWRTYAYSTSSDIGIEPYYFGSKYAGVSGYYTFVFNL